MTGIVLGQKFFTIKEYEEAKAKYEKAQKVPYIIFNSQSAKRFNSKRAGDDPNKRVPEEMLWKDVVVSCKHYGKPRSHDHIEGTKKRMNQRYVVFFP